MSYQHRARAETLPQGCERLLELTHNGVIIDVTAEKSVSAAVPICLQQGWVKRKGAGLVLTEAGLAELYRVLPHYRPREV